VIPIYPIKCRVSRADLARSSWIFSNQVDHLDDGLLTSDRAALVWVESAGRLGLYSKGALIAVRLLPAHFSEALHGCAEVSRESLIDLLVAQISALRTMKGAMFAFVCDEAFRWSHGDADGLPGLVIDDYGSIVVLQSSSAAGDFILPFVQEALERFDDRPLFERSSGQTRTLEGLSERTRWLRRGTYPEFGRATTNLAGLSLEFVPERAQKTGLFLDQRENLRYLAGRRLVARSMLDVCSYAGAWSCAGARSGVSRFTLIDADANALALAEGNITQNSNGTPEIVRRHGDLFEELSRCRQMGERFDIVVADPPAFTKSKKHVDEARRAYARLTKAASRLVSDNGIYVACSCSRHIGPEEFLEVVERNLMDEGWLLVHRGGQSPDHSVIIPRGTQEYLKCFFFQRRNL
jgi:23S rRNA (cytosine1962-C5)-methyltransferase